MSKENMSYRLSALLVLFGLNFISPAYSYAPKHTALGGGVRTGVLSEALFSNPAAINFLQDSSAFTFYGKSSVPTFNAGGKTIASGVYDGTNPVAKAGFAWIRESRARVVQGSQVFFDRTEYRLALAQSLSSSILAGVQGQYVTRRFGADETKFFNGTGGIIIPNFQGFRLGATYENFIERAGERPPIAAMGIGYQLMSAIFLYGDYGTVLKGNFKNKKIWSAGVEIPMVSDLYLLGGYFQEPINGYRGYSAGAVWQGPRTAFEYAYRATKGNPSERDHVFGVSVAL